MDLGMKTFFAQLTIFVIVFAAGCDAPEDQDEIAGLAPEEYDVVEEELEQENWHQFTEVAGDDTYGQAQLHPDEPTAGVPANLQFLVGSYHALPNGVRVWTRIGDPAAPKVYDEPDAGPDWIEMKPVTARTYNPILRESKNVPFEYETKPDEQGEVLFEAKLTFPPGESLLEFKTLAPVDGATAVGFEGWTVTAATPPAE